MIDIFPFCVLQIQRLQAQTLAFIKLCRENGVVRCNSNNITDNSQLKTFLDEWKAIESISLEKFNGGNTLSHALQTKIDGQNYLIPANCTFSNCDINEIPTLTLSASYDLIVIDPPWWNKYIRRTKQISTNNGYKMLDNEAIGNIPVETLTDPNKTLVAVWCTNAPSAINAVIDRFFVKWQLKLVSTWYWIKVRIFTHFFLAVAFNLHLICMSLTFSIYL